MLLSVSPRAESPLAQDARFEVLAPEERLLIDRIAADFYERAMRRAQTEAIEDNTAEAYRRADAETRAQFRDERRAAWRAMSERKKDGLKAAKRPLYDNLTEDQKAPFRRHAINRLDAAGAIDDAALASALQSEI
jgi:hypothetical protein